MRSVGQIERIPAKEGPAAARCRVTLPGALVDAAMPPILSGHLCTGKIWIDDALGGAARCRRVALRQGRVTAFVIAAPPAVCVQANRIGRIVRLGPSRRRRQNRRDRQNCQSRNGICAGAYRSRSRHLPFRPGRNFRSPADRSLCSQSIHVRALGRQSVAELARGSARLQKFPLAWPSFRLMPSYYRRLYVYCVGVELS